MDNEDVTQLPINDNEEQQSPQEPNPTGDVEEPEELDNEAPEDDDAGSAELEDEDSDEPQEDDTPDEQPISRRKQLRIQKLMEKMGVKPEDIAPSQDSKDKGVDFRDVVDADDEIYDKLSELTQEYGNRQRNEAVSEARFYSWRTELKYDADKVNQKYPQFDRTSEKFNPRLADAINSMYLSSVGYDGRSVKNPDVSFADYVEGMMELADEAAESKVQETRRNVRRQAARTGLRPDGSAPKRLDLTKAPQDMSDEELKAALKKMGLAPNN